LNNNNNRYDFPENSKFLVTGGAGFIGSNLVEKILEMGFYVRVLDNFSTGNKENIEVFYSNSNFDLQKGDIRNLEECQKACEGIDYVLHQAALGSVPRSIDKPIETNDVNVNGTLNMLVASKKAKVKRFVYASSSSVYGDDLNLPKIEDRIGNPLSPYAITKLTKELYSKNFNEIYDFPTIGLRYFNVFGKRQNPNSIYAAVIPKFIKTLLYNKPPIINGDGLQTRDFTFIDNVVQANLKACLAKEESFGKVFNIAFGQQKTIIQLYSDISRILRKEIVPKFGPDRVGDVRHSNADINKAMNLLNYKPDYDVATGLRLTIDWYKNNL